MEGGENDWVQAISKEKKRRNKRSIEDQGEGFKKQQDLTWVLKGIWAPGRHGSMHKWGFMWGMNVGSRNQRRSRSQPRA